MSFHQANVITFNVGDENHRPTESRQFCQYSCKFTKYENLITPNQVKCRQLDAVSIAPTIKFILE